MTNYTTSRTLTLPKLRTFETLGTQHSTFLVADGSCEPLLRKGEFAVVDTTGRRLAHNRLYLLQSRYGERWRRIGHLTCDRHGWWTKDLAGFRQTCPGGDGTVPVFEGISDGPYEASSMRAQLVGGVIGVAYEDLRKLLKGSAGYLNEAKANAAFDPGKYIDVLTVARYTLTLLSFRGRLSWNERFPERRVSDAHEKRVCAMREKLCAASTGDERLKNELLRRGMIDGNRRDLISA